MSKSLPNSAIYMTDGEEEVKKKIMGAFVLKEKLILILFWIGQNI